MTRKIAVYGVLLCTLWVSFATAREPASAPCVPGEKIGYVGRHDPGLASVVVFVHGVLSSGTGAWTYSRLWPRSDTFWPCLLREDAAFRQSNIFVHSYYTGLTESPSIDQVAEWLIRDLETDGVFNHTHITFVAHSMGGLVVSRMLLKLQSSKPDYVRRVGLVNFYGTPGKGADIAKVGSVLSKSVQIAEMSHPERLAGIADQWVRTAWPFRWFCMGETEPIGTMFSWILPVMVVPAESAGTLCSGKIDMIYGANHMEIVKPDSRSADPHRILRDRFARCVAPALNRVTSEDAGSDHGQAARSWFYALKGSLISAAPKEISMSIVEANLFKGPSFFRADAYMVSDDGINDAVPDEASGYRSRSDFPPSLLKLLVQQTELKSLDVQWISTVAKMHERILDQRVLELRTKFMANGALVDQDYAIALTPSSDSSAYLVLLVGFQGDKADPGLKGYLVVQPEPKTCD